MILGACDNDEEYNEAKIASEASISSKDSEFTADDNGGTINFKSNGGEVVVSVLCETDWTVSVSNGEWVNIVYDDSTLTLTAEQNDDETGLTAIVKLLTVSEKIEFATINVNQDGKAYLNLDGDSVSFYGFEDSATLAISSNFEIQNDNATDWLSIAISGEVLTLTVTDNNGDDVRSVVVTFTAGDGEENVAQQQVSVSQLSSKTIILVYTTSEADTEITLPFDSDEECVVSCVVDWGDGSEAENVTSVKPTHIYTEAGEYIVKVDGTVTSFYSNNINSSISAFLTAVKQWGQTGLTSMYYAFSGCSGLESIPTDKGGAFYEVKNFQRAFNSCSSLSEIPSGLFDYSVNATNFSYAFTGSGVTTIPARLFKGLDAVTTFQQVFSNCVNLTTVESEAFAGCSAVTTFKNAFLSCGLQTVAEDIFKGCTAVTDLSYVFRECVFTEIPAGIFDDCTAVTTFNSAFYDDGNLAVVPEGLFKNSTEVTDFSYCFRNCTNLTSVPTDLFDNCKKVARLGTLFYNCSNWVGESPYTVVDDVKVHLYERSDHTDVFTSITSNANCFYNCVGLTDYENIPSTWGGSAQ